MTTTWFRRLLQKFTPAGGRPRRRAQRRAAFQPCLEALEDRSLMATSTWVGGSFFSSNWSDQFNWSGFVAPQAGDDLVFSSTATVLSSFNNFPNLLFNSISFGKAGFTLGGGPLILGPGGVKWLSSSATGTDTINMPLILVATRTFDIRSAGAAVRQVGALSGPGGVTKDGAGILELAASANTFAGRTTINAGTARLLDGDEIVGDVTVNPDGTLDVNNTNETIGSLTVNGGTVNTGTVQWQPRTIIAKARFRERLPQQPLQHHSEIRGVITTTTVLALMRHSRFLSGERAGILSA